MFAGQGPADLGGAARPGRRDGYLDHVPIMPAGITTYVSLPARPTPVPRGGPLAGNQVVELAAQTTHAPLRPAPVPGLGAARPAH